MTQLSASEYEPTWKYEIGKTAYRTRCLLCGWLSGPKATKRSAQGAVAAHRCK